jgi:mRNA-degrading endonuclease RelE of RelBE toxin-antitoxin system
LEKKQQNKHLVDSELKKLIQGYNGETVSINIISLKGEWEGYYRIRKGDIRIIILIDEQNKHIKVHDINFRGNIYSK